MTVDQEVAFDAEDGWPIRGLLTMPDQVAGVPGVVLVPGSLHERDAWTSTAMELARHGIASLRVDVRGRGSSRGGAFHAQMPPGQRRLVRLDVEAAVRNLRSDHRVRDDEIAIVGEQDTAPACAEAASSLGGLAGVALLSPRGGRRVGDAVRDAAVPFLGLVSIEDRQSLRTTVDAYLAAPADRSSLHVLRGLGFGITMAAVRAFEHPDDEPIESMVTRWLTDTFGADDLGST